MQRLLVNILVLTILNSAVFVAELTARSYASKKKATSVTRIGVIVPDIRQAATSYATILGIDVPTITSIFSNDLAGRVEVADLHLENISIQLLQPLETTSKLYRDFVEKHRHGVHHLSVLSNDAPGFSDLNEELGLFVNYSPDTTALDDKTRHTFGLPTCITHIGIAVTDIQRSREALSEIFDVTPTPIQEFDEPNGRAAFTVFNLDNVSLELLQQIGEGTYSSFINEYGQGAHHIGLDLRRPTGSLTMEAQLDWLRNNGGANHVTSDSFVYMDFQSVLGLFVETLPIAVNEQIYPHPHRSH